MPKVSAGMLSLIPASLIAIVAYIILILAFVVSSLIAVIAAVVLGIVAWRFMVGTAANRALRALKGRPLPEGQEPRLESLVESVCASHGIAEPVLYVANSRAIDVAVVASRRGTSLVLTTGSLRQLDRLELEAVLARQLSLFGQGVQAATMLVAIAPLLGPFAGGLRKRLLDDRRRVRADLVGVRFTRYPPALASTLAKALAGTRIAPHPPSDHLWLIGSADTQAPAELLERVDTLNEL